MSHVARVDLVINDLDALASACIALSCTYDRTAVDYRWWGRSVGDYDSADAASKFGIPVSRYGKADAGVITVPGANWQIGVYQNPQKAGTYVLVYDYFGSEGEAIHRACGAGLAQLKAHYGAQVATKKLRAAGFQARTRVNQKTGRLQVVGTRSR